MTGFLKHRYCSQSGLINVVDNPHFEGGHQRPIVVNVQEVDLQDEFMVP